MAVQSNRGFRWLAGAALAGVLGLAAQHATAQTAASGQTIRMWTFLSPTGKTGREMVLKKLIDGFEAANPGVKIAVEVQDYRTLGTKFMAAHQSGTAPDVVMINVPNISPAIKLGALANLDDIFIKNWSKEEVADFDDPFFRFGSKPGAHYEIFLTRALDGQVYRTDLFKEAGIDPATLTTWDKFIAAAQKLTAKDAAGNVTRWGYLQMSSGADPVTPVAFSVIMEKQGSIFDKDFKANWATPAGVQGIQLEADMIQKYKITPDTAISTGQDDGMQAFGAGRGAIVRGTASRVQAMMQLLGPGKVGYFATPSFTEGKNSPSACSGWAAGIWSGSKTKELDGKFLEYLTSKPSATLWMTEAGQPPMRKSTVTDNKVFLDDPNNTFMINAAADLTKNCWLPPEGIGAGGWHEQLNNALQDVLVNHADPKAALEKTAAAYDRANRH